MITAVSNITHDLYETARAHGLGHEAALDAVEAGRLVCWCGSAKPCPGGAQRFVGCPIISLTPDPKGSGR